MKHSCLKNTIAKGTICTLGTVVGGTALLGPASLFFNGSGSDTRMGAFIYGMYAIGALFVWSMAHLEMEETAKKKAPAKRRRSK